MTVPIKLTQDQIDSLKEVGNIGSGQAASRLSDLIRRRCFIGLPEVNYMNTEGVRSLFGGGEAIAVALHMKVMGDIPSVMVVVTLKSHALKMIEYMSRIQASLSAGDLSFSSQFLLKELGEVLTRSFSEAITHFLMVKAKYAMPEIVIDYWSTALDQILKEFGGGADKNLVVHADFFDENKTFDGRFIYMLGAEAQKMILARLELLLGKE